MSWKENIIAYLNSSLSAIKAVVDAIQAKTDNLPASPAPASEYDTEMARITADVATEAKQDTIDGVVDAIKLVTDDLEGLRDNKTQAVNPADAGVATVTGSASANTYGSYTEAIASLGYDAWLAGISCELDQVDIYTITVATGAASSETDIAEFPAEPQAVNTSANIDCKDGIFVASGTRVSIRLKTVGGGSDTITNSRLIWRK